ncbi:MAG TPA: hypothetical protein VN229_10210 [Terriglobales bacterium]|nr:hypothetical protein [Terriglobales bacterium]
MGRFISIVCGWLLVFAGWHYLGLLGVCLGLIGFTTANVLLGRFAGERQERDRLRAMLRRDEIP